MASTKEEIIKAAVELFSEKGYDQTTIRDICRRAKANIAAVNYHFKCKTGLGEAVIEHLYENVRNQQQHFFDAEDITNEQEWKEAIYKFIFGFISNPEEYRNFFRMQLIFRELNNPSELFAKMFKKYLAPLQKQLIRYIRMGLPEDASEEKVLMWFITIMSQCVMFRKRLGVEMEIATIDLSQSEQAQEVAKHISGTVFMGLNYRKIKNENFI